MIILELGTKRLPLFLTSNFQNYSMSKGYFTDKTVKPAESDVLQIIGKAGIKWNTLVHLLADEMKMKNEFKFYGVNYGWALRFAKSGKSVIALYPDKDCFMVQIILNNNQLGTLLPEKLSEQTVRIINQTKFTKEGKWIYLTVDDAFNMKDILILLTARFLVK